MGAKLLPSPYQAPAGEGRLFYVGLGGVRNRRLMLHVFRMNDVLFNLSNCRHCAGLYFGVSVASPSLAVWHQN